MYTPLYTALLELKNKNRLSLHMPGHFDGRGLNGFDNLIQIDTTELPESDNLFHARGAIDLAQKAAARFFGAKETRFLVGGSSSGILAMVGAVCSPGDKIICDRFCHRSFISALIFSGAVPVWVCPELLEGGALWGGIDPALIEKALTENPDAKAVYITSPNYFGLSSDLEKIADIAHARNVPLLVDAAHGAHYGVSPLLPPSAVACGADISVAGAHKTLPALTQTAYLHINGSFPRLESMLKMCQTSSPSYILMASLDYARAETEENGRSLWDGLIENILKLFPEQAHANGSFVRFKDPARILLPFRCSPFAAAERLRLKHGISAECCYGGGVVCIASPYVTADELRLLKYAAEETGSALPEGEACAFAPFPGKAVLSPREAFFSQTETVPFSEAAGRICAREVPVYPPGAAQLMPGEIIRPEAVEALERISDLGGEIHGAENGTVTVVL